VPEDLLKRRGTERQFMAIRCHREIRGQLSNEVRARHGLPQIDPAKERPWNKRRTENWEKYRAKRAKK